MFRTALRPRWLALLVVVLIAATGMALLGQWQLNRARERGQAAAGRSTDTPRPLEQVLQARQTFPRKAVGQRVIAAGNWDGGHRLLVVGRPLGGRTGYWVVLPLRLPDGSAVPVVRGWVPDPSDPAAAPPSGAARIDGRLEPTEPAVDRPPGAGSGLPAGQIGALDGPDLIAAWPYPLLTGYLLASGEQPAPAGPVPARVPPPAPDHELALQNLSYAVQWWLFAGFGLFFWWRLVRDDHQGRLPGSGRRSVVAAPIATRAAVRGDQT